MKRITYTDPAPFEVASGYLFPFEPLDQTPDSTNLGRIKWNIEIHKTVSSKQGCSIREVLLWARQTNDPRYAAKTFRIACKTPSFFGTGDDCFLKHIWYVGLCRDHKAVVLTACPADRHRYLSIETHSGIGCHLEFLEVRP